MSKIPPFYEKNKEKLERAFDDFSQGATFVKDLSGNKQERTSAEIIVVQRNPITFEDYTNYDIVVRVLQEEKPDNITIGDTIEIPAIGDTFRIDGISNNVVTARLQCTKQ